MNVKWIKASERLPEKGGWYLIYAPSEGKPMINMAFWSSGRFSGLVKVWIDAITHWMPLPEGPE